MRGILTASRCIMMEGMQRQQAVHAASCSRCSTRDLKVQKEGDIVRNAQGAALETETCACGCTTTDGTVVDRSVAAALTAYDGLWTDGDGGERGQATGWRDGDGGDRGHAAGWRDCD